MIIVDPFLQLYAAKSRMTASTIVPYWVVASRVGCVLSKVMAAGGDLPLKLSFTPNIVVHLP